MSVRIEDVAAAARVSTATVSRTLHHLPGVGEATRKHVLQVAMDLGYTPSHSASSLASGTSHSIGIVLPDVSRWFFATAVEAMELALHAANYDALIYTLPDNTGKARPRFNPNVLRSKVDAIAVLSLYFDADEVAALRAMHLPVVFLSVCQPGFSYVGIDDEAAMATACNYAISLGHQIIAHLSGMTNDMFPNAPTQRRRNAWRRTLQQHGLEVAPELDSPARVMTAQQGYEAARRLLDRRRDITAIIASSDEMAMGAMQCLRERNMRLNTDVAVIGIDGNNLSEAFGLTTVAQPVEQESKALVSMLLAKLSGNDTVSHQVFPTKLMVRSSAAPQSSMIS